MTMTADTAVDGTDHAPGARVVFGRLLHAEWTKLRSVRSTMWSLVLLVILVPGLTVLLTWLTISQWSKADASTRAQVMADPTSTILGAGFQLGQLTICVLGVMVIASEYSTGMIRASLLAVPKRTPMLAAKAIVFAALVFVFGEIVAFPSFFIGAADPAQPRAGVDRRSWRASRGDRSRALPHRARLVRPRDRRDRPAHRWRHHRRHRLHPGARAAHPAAARPLGKHIHAYMPSEAGQLIGQAHQAKDDLLSPWQGLGVFCLWTAVLLAVATYLLRRRDA